MVDDDNHREPPLRADTEFLDPRWDTPTPGQRRVAANVARERQLAVAMIVVVVLIFVTAAVLSRHWMSALPLLGGLPVTVRALRTRQAERIRDFVQAYDERQREAGTSRTSRTSGADGSTDPRRR